MFKPPSYYDADYFLRGQEKGVSLLQDYRWLPEVTIRLAMAIIDMAAIPREQPVLDYGCATGYLVKALRLLHRDAYGIDHSGWAVANADLSVRDYIRMCRDGYQLPFNSIRFHTIIAKDVLEHCLETQVEQVLRRLRDKGDQLIMIVPLGDGYHYIIPYMEEEPDHVVRQKVEWWRSKAEYAGWTPQVVTNRVEGIKDQWVHYPNGHLILYAR